MATSIRAAMLARRLEAVNHPVLEKDEAGALSLGASLAIVGTIIGAVVAIALVAALAPTYFSSLADIGAVFTDANTTTGNADADNLLPVFGLLVAFGGLFAIVGLVLVAIAIKNRS